VCTPRGIKDRVGSHLVAIASAILGARLFRLVRVKVTAASVADRTDLPWWLTVVVFAVVAGLAVAVFPTAAGNGLQSLRDASIGLTLPLALGLCLGKLVGTTASLGSGAPGGALTPTIGISSGTAMVVLLGLSRAGVTSVVAPPGP
jgi:H+/Cl- antiporter ClcA